MTEVQNELDVARAYITDLRAALDQAETRRIHERAHLVDDYEKLVTGALRTITAQIDLLGDGLDALRRGSPHITDEFLDRALTALTRQRDTLRYR